MTKQTRYFTIISTGAVAAALTLALYFMTGWGINADEIRRISLTFVLAAEAALFVSMLIIAHISPALANKTFVWSGFTMALALYWIFTIIMALLGVFWYENARLFKLHELIALAITAVVLIAVYAASSHINAEDARAGDGVGFMADVENRLLLLKERQEMEPHRDRLDAMYEAVKYSDKSKFSEADERVESALAALEDMAYTGDGQAIEESMERLEERIKARNIRLANARRGGF